MRFFFVCLMAALGLIACTSAPTSGHGQKRSQASIGDDPVVARNCSLKEGSSPTIQVRTDRWDSLARHLEVEFLKTTNLWTKAPQSVSIGTMEKGTQVSGFRPVDADSSQVMRVWNGSYDVAVEFGFWDDNGTKAVTLTVSDCMDTAGCWSYQRKFACGEPGDD